MKTRTKQNRTVEQRIVRGLTFIAVLLISTNMYSQFKMSANIMNSHSLVKQLDEAYIDTSYTYKRPNDTAKWMPHNRELTLYDKNDLELGIVNHRYDANSKKWKSYDRTVHYYDEKSNKQESLYQKYNSDTKRWINIRLKAYTYNRTGIETELLYLEWQKATGKWYNTVRYHIDYNPDGQKSNIIIKLYAQATETWTNDTRYSFSYENGDVHPKFVYVDKWNSFDGKWEDHGKYHLAFDLIGNKTYEKRSTWSPVVNQWVDGLRFYMKYSRKNLVEHIEQRWNFPESKWVNGVKNIFEYDENNEMTQSVKQTWNELAQSWDTAMVYRYTDMKE